MAQCSADRRAVPVRRDDFARQGCLAARRQGSESREGSAQRLVLQVRLRGDQGWLAEAIWHMLMRNHPVAPAGASPSNGLAVDA